MDELAGRGHDVRAEYRTLACAFCIWRCNHVYFSATGACRWEPEKHLKDNKALHAWLTYCKKYDRGERACSP